MYLPRLEANEEHATGYIKITEAWLTYPVELRIHLLQDWLYAINSELESTKIILMADAVIDKARKAKNENNLSDNSK